MTSHNTISPNVLQRKKPNWPMLIIVILVVAVGIAYGGFQILAPGEEPEAVEAPAAEAPEPPEGALEVDEAAEAGAGSSMETPTPRELALRWRESVLAGTPYEDLDLRAAGDRFHLVYEARSGDSIRTVAGSYFAAAGFPPESEPELIQEITALHRETHDRGLWPGDEILLPVPEDATAPDLEPARKMEAGQAAAPSGTE